MKKLGFTVVFLLNLLVSSLIVSGAWSFNYSLEKVEVDGTELSQYLREVVVERGETVPVDIWVHSFSNIDKVHVEASLKGYEHGSIRSESKTLELDPNSVRKVPLSLEIPNDIDASKTYSLVVEVSDSQDSIKEEYLVRIKEKRHLLNVLDVIFRPGSNVEAGRFLRTVVRIENLGAKIEKDVRVSVSVPELGISSREFLDKLVTLNSKDDDSSLSTNELILQVPRDAKEGDYEVRVDVEYNRGSDIVTLKKMIHVDGETEEADETESLISVDSTSKTLARNEEGVFKITLANLDDSRKLYNAEVIGAETWANVIVEPGFLSVGSSEAGELLVKITPKENTAVGPKVFTIKIREDNTVVKEINLNAEISEQNPELGNVSLRRILEILFAVLIIVLIVLALIITFRKARVRDQGPGVETNSEQTYY